VHLVGFIIRIYHDARSADRQISKVSEREELVHLVGFIIRIFHDARSAERQISNVSEREELVHLVGFITYLNYKKQSHELFHVGERITNESSQNEHYYYFVHT